MQKIVYFTNFCMQFKFCTHLKKILSVLQIKNLSFHSNYIFIEMFKIFYLMILVKNIRTSKRKEKTGELNEVNRYFFTLWNN